MRIRNRAMWQAALGTCVALALGCAANTSTPGFDGGGAGDGGGPGGSSGGGSGSGGFGSSGGSSGGFGSSSSGSSSGSGSGSSSGGFGSSGSSSGGSSGSSSGGTACSPMVAAGALSLTANYLAASVIADGGYAYSYQDGMGSTACLDMSAFCGMGTTAVATPTGTVWGAGIGFSLNQTMATSMMSPPINPYAVPASDSGITYALSNLPTQGARLIINDNGTDYCAPISAASGTVKWASFNTACWNNSGTTLAGAPQSATHVQFQVTAGSASAAFDFCVTGVSFAP